MSNLVCGRDGCTECTKRGKGPQVQEDKNISASKWGTGETSTVLTFVNAAGQSVPPLIIHKGQHAQETWQLKAPGNMKITATERGYIMKSKFHEYGLHFVKFLKANGLADKTNLLIIDGHKSHLYNLPLYEAMRANNIEILTIPSHTSHLLQPLDSVPFAQLNKY